MSQLQEWRQVGAMQTGQEAHAPSCASEILSESRAIFGDIREEQDVIRNLAESANVDPKASSIAPSMAVLCELCARLSSCFGSPWQDKPGLWASAFALARLSRGRLKASPSRGRADSDRVTFD